MNISLSQCLITVHDPDEALKFYRDALGREADGDTVLALLIKGSLNGVNFNTDDVDATFEKVRASGTEVLQEPIDQAWGVRDCAFRDPSGNMSRFNQVRGVQLRCDKIEERSFDVLVLGPMLGQERIEGVLPVFPRLPEAPGLYCFRLRFGLDSVGDRRGRLIAAVDAPRGFSNRPARRPPEPLGYCFQPVNILIGWRRRRGRGG